MSRNFGDSEKYIKNLFIIGSVFIMNDKSYEVISSAKPSCSKGEPKTDIYILAKELKSSAVTEIKISLKKANADFLENKIGDERALALFGQDWKYIVSAAILKLQDEFKCKQLIYKDKKGRTVAGSITLGWKFELLNKPGGLLSNKITLSKKQVIDVYAGTNLPDDKKNALVDGVRIPDSGIADYLLFGNTELYTNTQDVIDNIILISSYTDSTPNVYLACKALNYRTHQHKFDGNRPLCVFVDWNVHNNKLTPTIRFDAPLVTRGNIVAEKLINSLKILNITTTDDITVDNISSTAIL